MVYGHAKANKNYLIYWEPDAIGVPVSEIKVIGALMADSIGAARRHMIENMQEYAGKYGQGNVYVIETPRRPDGCIFQSGNVWSYHQPEA